MAESIYAKAKRNKDGSIVFSCPVCGKQFHIKKLKYDFKEGFCYCSECKDHFDWFIEKE